jgi:hypothetical protein
VTFLDISKDEESIFLKGLIRFMNEHSTSQIDPPAFYRMFYVGIRLLRVIGKMLRSSNKPWLKYIQDTHSLKECDIICVDFMRV